MKSKKLKLIIGGYANGKLDYAIRGCRPSEYAIYDAVFPKDEEIGNLTIIVNNLQRFIRDCILDNGCPEEEILSFLEKCGDCIVICDEIGNGIVPVNAFEREYRERVGRILIGIAAKADEVERVICGIAQRIK